MELIESLDIKLLQLINDSGGPVVDQIMIGLSDKYIWIPLYLYIIFRLYQRSGISAWIPVLMLILLVTCTDQLTSSFMKSYFERLRPCKDPTLSSWISVVHKCGGRYGFASSHAANTMVLAFFLFLWEERTTFSKIMIAWAALVGFSRIYLGVHFPGDVIVGILIGILLAIPGYYVVAKIMNRAST